MRNIQQKRHFNARQSCEIEDMDSTNTTKSIQFIEIKPTHDTLRLLFSLFILLWMKVDYNE